MRDLSMPLWERYLMTIEEASMYFRIGENKLREVANEHKDVCVLQNCKSQYKNVGLGQYKNVGFPTFLYCLFSLHLL